MTFDSCPPCQAIGERPSSSTTRRAPIAWQGGQLSKVIAGLAAEAAR